jgi:hypothetical protein
MTGGDRGGGQPGPDPDRTWDRDHEEHRRRQARLGLKLTPAERLRWLETTMATMRGWVGRAREGRPLPPEED